MQTLLPLYRACIYFFYSEKITIFFIYTDAVLFPVFRTVYSGKSAREPPRPEPCKNNSGQPVVDSHLTGKSAKNPKTVINRGHRS